MVIKTDSEWQNLLQKQGFAVITGLTYGYIIQLTCRYWTTLHAPNWLTKKSIVFKQRQPKKSVVLFFRGFGNSRTQKPSQAANNRKTTPMKWSSDGCIKDISQHTAICTKLKKKRTPSLFNYHIGLKLKQNKNFTWYL